MMQNITKLGQFTIKHMTGQTSGGKDYDFYSLEKRTFNKQKNEWESKDIILSVPDMAVVSAVCAEAAAQLAREEAARVNARLSGGNGDAAGYDVPF